MIKLHLSTVPAAHLLLLSLLLPGGAALADEAETAGGTAPANGTAPAGGADLPATVSYGREAVDGVDIFFREAGREHFAPDDRPSLVLLHGFPSSSHQYREVLPALGKTHHVIAPDYPGFGDSDFPDADEFEYTFDHLGEVMNRFLEQRGVTSYVLMIHDYGAPVGYRIALADPERVEGLIVMNGNAYEEGIGREGWGPVLDYWEQKTPELEETIAENVFSLDGLRWQYTHGTRDPEAILPDNWNLDHHKLSRPGQHAVQLALFHDYQNNVKAYPRWQAYLREHRPPTLIVWGKNDAFFPESGARAYLRDLPDAELHLFDTGHFPLEEDAAEILPLVQAFLADGAAATSEAAGPAD